MRTTEQLVSEASDMNVYLKIEQGNDLQTLMNSLVKLESYLASANEMLAEAKARKEEATLNIIKQDDFMKKLSPSMANKYLSGTVKMESYAVDLIDGICSTIRNSMDCKRTRISQLKEECRQLKMPDMYRQNN